MEKSASMMNMAWAAIAVDIVGIILVLAGGVYTYYHAKSGVGISLFWVGWILLIIALILLVLGMKKPMQKMSS